MREYGDSHHSLVNDNNTDNTNNNNLIASKAFCTVGKTFDVALLMAMSHLVAD